MWCVALVALVTRVGFAAASFALNHGVLIPDEQQYIDLADTVARGGTAESWYPRYGQSLYDSTWVFVAPLRLLFELLTSTRLIGQLWSAAYGVLVAVLVVRLGREVLPTRWATAAGVIVALLPSQVLFSSVVLRESMVWAALTVAVVGFVSSVRSFGWSALTWMAATVCGLLALGWLREQTLLAATFALVPATAVAATNHRRVRVAGAVVLLVAIPWLAGTGPAGRDVLQDRIGTLGWLRSELAQGAASGFVPTHDSGGVGQEPPGKAEQESPRDVTIEADDSLKANVRAVPAGAAGVLLRPFLWEANGGIPLRLAALENLVWYLLYGLAVWGYLGATRAQRQLLAYPGIASVAIIAVAILTQGNLGTAFRHRGQVLPLLVVPAILGVAQLHAWRCTRRNGLRD